MSVVAAMLLMMLCVGGALTQAQKGGPPLLPPQPVELRPLVASGASTVGLSWSVSAEADFLEYRVYRGTHSGVSVRDTLIGTISDPTQTTAADEAAYPAAHPGKSYFYRVFVVTGPGQSVGSNERMIRMVAATSKPKPPGVRIVTRDGDGVVITVDLADPVRDPHPLYGQILRTGEDQWHL